MKNKIKISWSVWQTFNTAIRDNPGIKFIGWAPSASKATVYLDVSGADGGKEQEALTLGLTTDDDIKEWATAILEPHTNINTLEITPAPSATDPQPGDTADGATLGAFLRKKESGTIVFVTANHADTDDTIYVGNSGKQAKVLMREPDLDALVAGFEPSIKINPTVKYTEVTPKSIASSWSSGRRFGLIGARSGKVAFARAYRDNFILSKADILNGNPKQSKTGVTIELNKFELILEPCHTIRNGDSGGPVLFARESKDECQDKIAGIMIEITSICGNPAVIATKMSAIADKFGVVLP